jgi:hypothetical protein
MAARLVLAALAVTLALAPAASGMHYIAPDEGTTRVLSSPVPAPTMWQGTRGYFVVADDFADPYTWALKQHKLGYDWVCVLVADGSHLVNADNAAAWLEEARRAGLKAGVWTVLRTDPKAEAFLASELVHRYHADFYVSNPEAEYKADSGGDPGRARVFVDNFHAAVPHGVVTYGAGWGLLSAVMDFTPWQQTGWQFMPEAYENDDVVYALPRVMEQAKLIGWPVDRVTPIIATYTGARGRIPGTTWSVKLAQVGIASFGIYSAEYTSDADAVALAIH